MPVYTPNITERFIYTDFINMMNIRDFTTLNIYVNSVTGVDAGPGRGSSPTHAYKHLKFALNDAFSLLNKAQVVIHLAGADPHLLDDGLVFPEILSPDQITLDLAPTFGFNKRAPLVLRADPTLVGTIAALAIVSQADNAFSGLKEITTTGGLVPSAFAGKWMLDATGILARVIDNDAAVIFLCYAGVDLTGPLLVYGEGATIAPANALSTNSTVVLRGGAAPVILEGITVQAPASASAVEVGPNQQAILIACTIEKLSMGGSANSLLSAPAAVELLACNVTDWLLQGANLRVTNCYSADGSFTGSPELSSVLAVGSYFHHMFQPLFFASGRSPAFMRLTDCKVDEARANPGIRTLGGIINLSTVDVANNASSGLILQGGTFAQLNAVKSSIANNITGLNVQQSVADVDANTDVSGTTQDIKVGSLVIGTWAANFRAGSAPFGVSEPQSNAIVFQAGVGLSTAPQSSVLETGAAVVNLTKADSNVFCDATVAPITVNLPPIAVSLGLEITVKKTDVTANTVTLDGFGGELIDATATKVLAAQYDSMTIVAGSAQWFVKAQVP